MALVTKGSRKTRTVEVPANSTKEVTTGQTEQGLGLHSKSTGPPTCWLTAFLFAKVPLLECGTLTWWHWSKVWVVPDSKMLVPQHITLSYALLSDCYNFSHFFNWHYPLGSRFRVNSSERHSWLSGVVSSSVWTQITLCYNYLHILLLYKIVCLQRQEPNMFIHVCT